MDSKTIDFINCHATSYVNEFMSGDSTTRARMQEILTDFGKQLIDCLQRDGKDISQENSVLNKPVVSDLLFDLRQAVADYMYSEGCSCCQNIEAHKEHKKRLAELLDVEPYDDNSGYDFSKYRKQ